MATQYKEVQSQDEWYAVEGSGKVWIVGMWHDGKGWELCGLYTTRDRALKEVRGSGEPNAFLASMPLNTEMVMDRRELDTEYPNIEEGT